MQFPQSFTTVTTLSKVLAMVLTVSLPFFGFYIGYKYGKSLNTNNIVQDENAVTSVPTKAIKPTEPIVQKNTIKVAEFDLTVPSSWKLKNIDPDYGAIITTQEKPNLVNLMLNIKRVDRNKVQKGDQLLGVTIDRGSIYEEVGIGGADFDPYLVYFGNGEVYNFQWTLQSTQVNPDDEGIVKPNVNFSKEDLLAIVKSATMSNY